MDALAAVTPPSRRSEARLLRSRPPPCLAQPFDDDSSDNNNNNNNNNSHAVTPPPKTKSPISPSPLHLALHSSNHTPLQELLLLSHSPARRQRSLVLVQGENVDPAASNPRRKSKKSVATAAATAAASMGLVGCASPRNVRRARRRLEKEINREERQSDVFEDDAVRVRKRRPSKTANSRREKPSLPPAAPPSGPPLVDKSSDNNEQIGLDAPKEVIRELIMWKNVARSSLWFGLGSLFFISSSFSRDLNFCAVSAVSNVGLFVLALAFFSDSISQRRHEKVGKRFRLTEEDILRVVRLVLPAINVAIGTAQEVFSGEPSMTLKVAPVLLFAAKYGHHITIWRLLATGFFVCFTAPKLYATYSTQILTQADDKRRYVSEAWRACRRKKVMAISAATMLWNLSSVKTRIFAAFICLVVLRYYRQRHSGEEGGAAAAGGGDWSQFQGDKEGGEPQQVGETTQKRAFAYALVVADDEEGQMK